MLKPMVNSLTPRIERGSDFPRGGRDATLS